MLAAIAEHNKGQDIISVTQLTFSSSPLSPAITHSVFHVKQGSPTPRATDWYWSTVCLEPGRIADAQQVSEALYLQPVADFAPPGRREPFQPARAVSWLSGPGRARLPGPALFPAALDSSAGTHCFFTLPRGHPQPWHGTPRPTPPTLLPWAPPGEDTPAFPREGPLASHTSSGCFYF